MSDVAWTVRHDEQLCCYSVENDEELIADLFYAHDIPEDQEQQRVKAHTVAAAPVLVEALEGLLSFNGHYDGCYGGPPYNRICEPVCAQARSALALARGETA